jgi:hypothetical protein
MPPCDLRQDLPVYAAGDAASDSSIAVRRGRPSAAGKSKDELAAERYAKPGLAGSGPERLGLSLHPPFYIETDLPVQRDSTSKLIVA